MTLHLIGMDEVGWGSGAGPLVVAACYVHPGAYEEIRRWGFRDSKALGNHSLRTPYDGACDRLFQRVCVEGYDKISWAVSQVESFTMDTVSPMTSLLSAYRNSLLRLRSQLGFSIPDIEVILDGSAVVNSFPKELKYRTEPKADANYLQCSAASVIAKAYRDQHMRMLDKTYPLYHFGNNSGYLDADHMDAIWELGPIPGVHRLSYLQKMVKRRTQEAVAKKLALPSWVVDLGWHKDMPSKTKHGKEFSKSSKFAAAVHQLIKASEAPASSP